MRKRRIDKVNYRKQYLEIQENFNENFNKEVETVLFEQRVKLIKKIAKDLGIRQRTKKDKQGRVLIPKQVDPYAEAYRELMGYETSFTPYFTQSEFSKQDYYLSRFKGFLMMYSNVVVNEKNETILDKFVQMQRGELKEQQFFDIVEKFKKENTVYLSKERYVER